MTHTHGRTPLDEGSALRRNRMRNTKHSHVDGHTIGGIRTRNPNKRAATDRPPTGIGVINILSITQSRDT